MLKLCLSATGNECLKHCNDLYHKGYTNSMSCTCVSIIFYAEIAESPRDTTVFINQTAVFICVTHGTPLYLYWRVNGTAYTHLPSDIRDDLVSFHAIVVDTADPVLVLTITGRAEYNGTRVQCVAGGEGVERESENATLNIQGK